MLVGRRTKCLQKSYNFCQDVRLPPTRPEASAPNERRNGAPSTLSEAFARRQVLVRAYGQHGLVLRRSNQRG